MMSRIEWLVMDEHHTWTNAQDNAVCVMTHIVLCALCVVWCGGPGGYVEPSDSESDSFHWSLFQGSASASFAVLVLDLSPSMTQISRPYICTLDKGKIIINHHFLMFQTNFWQQIEHCFDELHLIVVHTYILLASYCCSHT